jgi:Baseplate J-like protein
MATVFPLLTLSATVTPTGITAPSYTDVHQSLQASFKAVYGSDSYIDPDSQDGQLLAIFARAIFDCNQTAIAVYQSYSPSTAQGEGLSSVVRINGIQRSVGVKSQVNLLISGEPGTLISNGIAADTDTGAQWLLPPAVVIGPLGETSVTALSKEPGNIASDTFKVSQIRTPTLGWRYVTNLGPAVPGRESESDAQLRIRQAQSTALPARSVLQSITGALAGLPGVLRAKVLENDTNVLDSDGLPPHSIAAVVLGGDLDLIATTLAIRKTPGCYTHGTTLVLVPDGLGIPKAIRFFVPAPVPVFVKVTMSGTYRGYTNQTGLKIRQLIADYINKEGSDSVLDVARLYLPAQLFGGTESRTYNIASITVGRSAATLSPSDIVAQFNEYFTASLDSVSVA